MVAYAVGSPEWEEQQKALQGGSFVTMDMGSMQQPASQQTNITDYSAVFQDRDNQTQTNLTGYEGITSAVKGYDPSLTAGQVQFEARNLSQDQNYLGQAGAEEQKRQKARNLASYAPAQVKVEIPQPVLSQPPEQAPAPAPAQLPQQTQQQKFADMVNNARKGSLKDDFNKGRLNQGSYDEQLANLNKQQPPPGAYQPIAEAIQQPKRNVRPGVEGQTPEMKADYLARQQRDQAVKDQNDQNYYAVQDRFKQLDQQLRAVDLPQKEKQAHINNMASWYKAAKDAAGNGRPIPQPPRIPQGTQQITSTQTNAQLAQAYKDAGGRFAGALSVNEILGELNKNSVFRDQILQEMGGRPQVSPTTSNRTQQAAPVARPAPIRNAPVQQAPQRTQAASKTVQRPAQVPRPQQTAPTGQPVPQPAAQPTGPGQYEQQILDKIATIDPAKLNMGYFEPKLEYARKRDAKEAGSQQAYQPITEAIQAPPSPATESAPQQVTSSQIEPVAAPPQDDDDVQFGMQVITYDDQGNAYTDSTMTTRAPGMDQPGAEVSNGYITNPAPEQQQVQQAEQQQEQVYQAVTDVIQQPQVPAFMKTAAQASMQKLQTYGSIGERLLEMGRGSGSYADRGGGIDADEQKELWTLAEDIAKMKVLSQGNMFKDAAEFKRSWKGEQDSVFQQLWKSANNVVGGLNAASEKKWRENLEKSGLEARALREQYEQGQAKILSDWHATQREKERQRQAKQQAYQEKKNAYDAQVKQTQRTRQATWQKNQLLQSAVNTGKLSPKQAQELSQQGSNAGPKPTNTQQMAQGAYQRVLDSILGK